MSVGSVLHVISSMDPATGGPPAVVMRLAAAQVALGFEVHTLAYGLRDAGQRLAASIGKVPLVEHVHQHYLSDLTRVEHAWPRQAMQTCAKLVREVDVVHVHGIWDHLCRVSANAARRSGTPYFITPHSSFAYPEFDSCSFKNLKKRLAWRVAYRQMLMKASFVHVLTGDELDRLKALDLGVPIVVAPNGVFLEELSPKPPAGAFLQQHASLGGEPYVLFMGRLHPQKGLDLLVAAFARVLHNIPKAQLVIAGPDYGARDALVRDARGRKISDRIHLVGPLFGRDKLAALLDCECFCLPSRQEGFSVAITEAMACGRPVVISEPCHFPEVAEHDAGRVVPLDADRIAAALLELLDNPAKATAMGRRGADLVRARYTWPAIAQQMVKAYKQAVGH